MQTSLLSPQLSVASIETKKSSPNYRLGNLLIKKERVPTVAAKFNKLGRGEDGKRILPKWQPCYSSLKKVRVAPSPTELPIVTESVVTHISKSLIASTHFNISRFKQFGPYTLTPPTHSHPHFSLQLAEGETPNPGLLKILYNDLFVYRYDSATGPVFNLGFRSLLTAQHKIALKSEEGIQMQKPWADYFRHEWLSDANIQPFITAYCDALSNNTVPVDFFMGQIHLMPPKTHVPLIAASDSLMHSSRQDELYDSKYQFEDPRAHFGSPMFSPVSKFPNLDDEISPQLLQRSAQYTQSPMHGTGMYHSPSHETLRFKDIPRNHPIAAVVPKLHDHTDPSFIRDMAVRTELNGDFQALVHLGEYRTYQGTNSFFHALSDRTSTTYHATPEHYAYTKIKRTETIRVKSKIKKREVIEEKEDFNAIYRKQIAKQFASAIKTDHAAFAHFCLTMEPRPQEFLDHFLSTQQQQPQLPSTSPAKRIHSPATSALSALKTQRLQRAYLSLSAAAKRSESLAQKQEVKTDPEIVAFYKATGAEDFFKSLLARGYTKEGLHTAIQDVNVVRTFCSSAHTKAAFKNHLCNKLRAIRLEDVGLIAYLQKRTIGVVINPDSNPTTIFYNQKGMIDQGLVKYHLDEVSKTQQSNIYDTLTHNPATNTYLVSYYEDQPSDGSPIQNFRKVVPLYSPDSPSIKRELFPVSGAYNLSHIFQEEV